jgi:hypothetical protein
MCGTCTERTETEEVEVNPTGISYAKWYWATGVFFYITLIVPMLGMGMAIELVALVISICIITGYIRIGEYYDPFK